MNWLKIVYFSTFDINHATYRYQFDMLKLEAEEIKTIQKTDVVKWYNTYLRPSSPKCRQLAIHVWGCNTNLEEAQIPANSWQLIEDIASFKSSSEFYPFLCWVQELKYRPLRELLFTQTPKVLLFEVVLQVFVSNIILSYQICRCDLAILVSIIVLVTTINMLSFTVDLFFCITGIVIWFWYKFSCDSGIVTCCPLETFESNVIFLI